MALRGGAGGLFTGWDWNGDGEADYGIVGNRAQDDISMSQFFAQAAANAKQLVSPC
jgi:hypothetical protein